jgi:hypothetical protein
MTSEAAPRRSKAHALGHDANGDGASRECDQGPAGCRQVSTSFGWDVSVVEIFRFEGPLSMTQPENTSSLELERYRDLLLLLARNCEELWFGTPEKTS